MDVIFLRCWLIADAPVRLNSIKVCSTLMLAPTAIRDPNNSRRTRLVKHQKQKIIRKLLLVTLRIIPYYLVDLYSTLVVVLRTDGQCEVLHVGFPGIHIWCES